MSHYALFAIEEHFLLRFNNILKILVEDINELHQNGIVIDDQNCIFKFIGLTLVFTKYFILLKTFQPTTLVECVQRQKLILKE